MKLIHTIVLMLFSLITWGQTDAYYNSADGKCGAALKSALKDIVANHTKIYYGNLWAMYESTDFVENKRNTAGHYQVFDYYSATTHYFNGDGTRVDGMDREHTVPQSWWGGGTEAAQGSDLFHVIPSESNANSKKSNYSLGVVSGSTSYSNTRMKTGRDKNGRMVFEPADEYKGDFARMYFYIATCYPKIWEAGTDYAMQSDDYPTLKSWIIDLLLQWHRQDPVSEWEMKRQERVARFQHNRNPYIDYPELAEHIWGDKKNTSFDFATAQRYTLNTDTYIYGTLFQSTLIGDRAGFTVKNVKGSYTVWKMDNTYGWKATGFLSGSNRNTESWLISPAIQLPTEYAVLAFDHALNYGTHEVLSVCISTDKTNWQPLDIPKWPAGNNWSFVYSGDVSLQDWLGKTIYIGFRYTSTTTSAATWEIQNFSVFGGGNKTDATPVTAIPHKDKTQYSRSDYYTLGGQRVATPHAGSVYIHKGKKLYYK